MNSTETLNEQEIGKMLKLNDPGKAFHSSRQSFWECFTHSAYTDTNIVFKDGLLPVNKACFAALSNNLKFCIEDVHDLIIVPDLSIHSFDDVLLTFTEHSIAGYGQLGRSCFSEQFHQTLEHLGVNLFTTIENFNSGFAELTKKLKTAETNLQIHIRKQKSKSFYYDPQERTAASIFGINEENTYSAREVSMVEGKHSDRHKKTRVRAVRANKMKAPRLCSQILHDPSKIWDSMNNSECMKEFLWCGVCTTDQQFVSSQDLETHMRKHHQYDGRVMTCTFCHCPCMGEEAVVVHEQTLCKNKGNRCVYCEVKHPNRQALLDHMLEQHGTGEQKYCYVCKTSFKVLKANYVTEWPHLESCLESDGEAKKMKVLQTKEDEDWEDLCNTSQTSFLDKCLNCSKNFTSLPIKSVLEHFLKKAECRSDERNRDLLSFTQQVSQNYSYYCEKCGVSFKEEDWLERHLATHKEHLEYFDCKQDSCKFKFITELALDLHTSSFHPDAKLECSICKSMVPKGDFKDHVISHAVQCKQCEKIFAHKGVLNNHILSVHDEKHKRIQRLKQKRFDEESSQQRHQMNNMQPHEATVEAGEVPHGLRNSEQLMNQVGQSSQNQIAVVHPSIIAQPPYQQIVVPVTHIQHLNVNQMSHFLQINNSQGQFQ